MAVYWIAFLVPALAVFSPFRATLSFRRYLWLATALWLVFFIGLRHEVGSDWPNYLAQFRDFASGIMIWSEPGYALANRGAAALGLEVHAVNMLCGAIFVVGLLSFCRHERLSWLALAIAVPYAVIVVGMGYTKQAASLGFLLWGLVRLERGRVGSYVLAVLLGTTFHLSTLVGLLFAALSIRDNRVRVVFVVLALAITAVIVVVSQQLDYLYDRIAALGALDSRGAAIRLGMNVLAFGVLLLFRTRWREQYGPITVWAWMGGLSVIGLLLVPFASTTVDRIALFFLPLQLAVWARVPTLVRSRLLRTQLVMTVLVGYAAVLTVWLNFGSQSENWVPYKNILFL